MVLVPWWSVFVPVKQCFLGYEPNVLRVATLLHTHMCPTEYLYSLNIYYELSSHVWNHWNNQQFVFWINFSPGANVNKPAYYWQRNISILFTHLLIISNLHQLFWSLFYSSSYPSSHTFVLLSSQRTHSAAFHQALLETIMPSRTTGETRLVDEVSHMSSSLDSLVEMLARCLPHITPNVLLAKREVGFSLMNLFSSNLIKTPLLTG